MINILWIVAAYIFMEFVAWSNHKYIMHGFLWKWHQSHHEKDHLRVTMGQVSSSGFEKNDYFFLIYAIPAILLMLFGFYFALPSLVYIAVGITLYGFTYFMVHEIIIHERIRIPYLQKNHHAYTRAIINAHLAHHRPKNKNDFKNFGLLIFPLRYFKK
jgi:beta-carotene 3-hydroxylase